MDPHLVHRLSAPDAAAVLAELQPYDEDRALALGTGLRARGVPPDLAAALLTQARLRRRAEAKFGADAHRMLFTADGLEQATRPQLADRHAERFAAAGVDTVWDLGCGIGSDAAAFARAGLHVVAVDRDATALAVAQVNLAAAAAAAARGGRVRAVHAPVEEVDPGAAAVWLDPARRRPGRADAGGQARRTSRLRDLSPGWDHVLRVAGAAPAAGAKLGPSFPHAALPDGCEAQWTSFRGELLECALWWGAAVRSPGRSAAVHTAAGWVELTDDGSPAPPPAGAGTGPWLYEPDLAAVQAGLTGLVRRPLPDAGSDDSGGYVVSRIAAEVPWARRYRILDRLPLRTKELRRWARGRRLGRLTVKKRGVALDPDRLRRDLRLSGDGEALVVVARFDGTSVVLEVERA